MIEVENVYFSYDGASYALENVSLKLEGGVIGVVGPNGSGKTTLLKVASLLYKPARGRVLVDGKDFWKLGVSERVGVKRKIVYVQDQPVLIRGSVIDNLIYGLLLRGVSRDEAQKKVVECLKLLGAEYLLEKSARNLSAGEAQLVSLTRAFVLRPRFLFLDEPLANLDFRKRKNVLNYLRRLASDGVAIIMATHDRLVISKIAERVVHMENGRILEVGRPESVLTF